MSLGEVEKFELLGILVGEVIGWKIDNQGAEIRGAVSKVFFLVRITVLPVIRCSLPRHTALFMHSHSFLE